jgi:hypothetical protein
MPTFDDLWNAATAWGEQQSGVIASTGRALARDELAIAAKVGVQTPERIRVLIVESVPFPGDPTLRALGEKVGLAADSSGGMTLGHGIFLRADQQHRPDIWPHEFRHVAQYECFGSIRAFMFFYLKELLHFRYGPGPLEIDATNAEKLGELGQVRR